MKNNMSDMRNRDIKRIAFSLMQKIRGFVDRSNYTVINFLVVLIQEGIISDAVINQNDSNAITDSIQKWVSVDEDRKLIAEDFLLRSSVLKPSIIIDMVEEICSSNLSTEGYVALFDELIESAYGDQFLGEVTVPKEVIEIMNSMIPESAKSIFNPFSGIGNIGFSISVDKRYVGLENNLGAYQLSKLREILVSTNDSFELMCKDPIEYLFSDTHKNIKFDTIISTPPLNLKIPNEIYSKGDTRMLPVENIIIEKGLKYLHEGGTMLMLVPNGFLFNPRGLELRKSLVNNGQLKKVISLPAGALFGTSIQVSLLVIKKSQSKSENVTLIDASALVSDIEGQRVVLDINILKNILSVEQDRCTRIVDASQVAENDFDLSVERYFLYSKDGDSNFTGKPLSDIARQVKTESSYSDELGQLVNIGEFGGDLFVNTIDPEFLETKDLKQGQHKKLEKNAILVPLRFSNCKASIFKYEGQCIFISNNILAFEITDENVELEYLTYLLNSEVVNKQFKALLKGATIPYISKKDFLSIRLDIPTNEEQLRLFTALEEEHDKRRLQETGLIHRFEQFKKESNENLRIKKHNIMQHLNNVKSSADVIFGFLKKNEKVGLGDVVNKRLEITLETRILRMIESLEYSLYYVDNITDDLTFDEPEILSIHELVKEAVTMGRKDDNLFDVSITFGPGFKEARIYSKGEEVGLIPIGAKSKLIKISKKGFFELYNNILENAIQHGFLGDKKYVFNIEIDKKDSENKLVITFKNDGEPMPKGMAERYNLKGEKAGVNANTGIGSWKVVQVVNHFEGEIEVLSEPSKEFSVAIQLTFQESSDEFGDSLYDWEESKNIPKETIDEIMEDMRKEEEEIRKQIEGEEDNERKELMNQARMEEALLRSELEMEVDLEKKKLLEEITREETDLKMELDKEIKEVFEEENKRMNELKKDLEKDADELNCNEDE